MAPRRRAVRSGPADGPGSVSRRWHRFRAASIALLVPLGLGADPVARSAAESGKEPRALERVVVIGASVSAGFQLSANLASALEASIVGEGSSTKTFANSLFFLNPLDVGEAEVERALQHDPTLVVAVDFLFWYGYGGMNAEGGALEEENQRLELLEEGLEQLAEFECPLVISDFPDMSASVGKMLTRRQMPAPETLTALSRRVHAWAENRPGVIVLPFAKLVHDLGADEPLKIGRHEWPGGSTRRLLQRDRLHPTLEGLCGIAQLVADQLVQHELARSEEFNFDLEQVLEALRSARGRAEATKASAGG